MSRRLRRNDDGASLVLVLLIVLVLSVVLGAVLSQVGTSFKSTEALRDRAGDSYAADGAAQVAINDLRTGYGFSSGAFNNTSGTACFGTNGSTLNLPGFYPPTNGLTANNAGSASVSCSADPDTGVSGTFVPINDANRPGQAILTLGTNASEDGINVKALNGNIPFTVHGTVKSNSNIRVVSGSLQANNAVTAHTGCTGTIVSTPPPVCNAGINTDPAYAFEPSFATPPVTIPPTYQPVPANASANCPGGVMTFNPGYYDDAASLTTLMGGTGACRNSTWWFTPGVYYFDFHNNNSDANVDKLLSTGNTAGADVWNVGSGHLVAGTPTTTLTNNPTIPGACQSPINSTTAVGVQFIFGGDSQFQVSGSADSEICGTYHSDRPPLAVYGISSGGSTTLTYSGPTGASPALKMSSVVSATNFSNNTNITEQDGTAATWAKTGNSLQTATVTVAGYAPPAGVTIPAGSIVKSATIRVHHWNSTGYVTTGNPKDSLALTFTPTGGTAITPTGSFTLPSTAGTSAAAVDSLDLYGGGTSAFDQFVHDHGFTGGQMAYTAKIGHASTESLDSIQLDVTFVPPAYRAETTPEIASNCMNQTYSGGGAGAAACPVIYTSTSYAGKFYIQGTTYTPTVAIDLALSNVTQQVMRFGVISRTLWITETGSIRYNGPVIEVPDATFGGGTVVYLTVYVCPGVITSSCSTSSSAIKSLQARVMMKDSGSIPTPSDRKITVLSWSNIR